MELNSTGDNLLLTALATGAIGGVLMRLIYDFFANALKKKTKKDIVVTQEDLETHCNSKLTVLDARFAGMHESMKSSIDSLSESTTNLAKTVTTLDTSVNVQAAHIENLSKRFDDEIARGRRDI